METATHRTEVCMQKLPPTVVSLSPALPTPSPPQYMWSLSECSLRSKRDRASPLLITLTDSRSPRTKFSKTQIHTWPGLTSISNHLLCWHPPQPFCTLASQVLKTLKAPSCHFTRAYNALQIFSKLLLILQTWFKVFFSQMIPPMLLHPPGSQGPNPRYTELKSQLDYLCWAMYLINLGSFPHV